MPPEGRTLRLYWVDPYAREFEATVESVRGKDVVLEATYFYPQGGGQASDKGSISTIPVNHVRNEGDLILHTLEAEPPFKAGDRVRCSLDWGRRYRTMKLHSSAHILYYAMQKVFGAWCRPASPGLTDDRKSREDYLFDEKPDLERLRTVEARVNELISASLEIRTWSEGSTRYWEMSPYPRMMCGGTHPRSSREIGAVTVTRGKKPGAGKERIEVALLISE